MNSFDVLKNEIEDMIEKLKELRAKENITSADIDIMEDMNAWIKKALILLEEIR